MPIPFPSRGLKMMFKRLIYGQEWAAFYLGTMSAAGVPVGLPTVSEAETTRMLTLVQVVSPLQEFCIKAVLIVPSWYRRAWWWWKRESSAMRCSPRRNTYQT